MRVLFPKTAVSQSFIFPKANISGCLISLRLTFEPSYFLRAFHPCPLVGRGEYRRGSGFAVARMHSDFRFTFPKWSLEWRTDMQPLNLLGCVLAASASARPNGKSTTGLAVPYLYPNTRKYTVTYE